MKLKESNLIKLNSLVAKEQAELRDYWLGRILTLVDATFQDPQQRKAQKDLIKDVFYGREYFSSRIEWLFKSFSKAEKLEYWDDLPNTTLEITEEVNPFEIK